MAEANPLPRLPAHECGRNAPVFQKALRQFELCTASGGVLMDPWTTQCGHSYCGNFVRALKEAAMETFSCVATSSSDPSSCCGVQVNVTEMYQDGSLALQIEKKLVKCTNHELGCRQFVMYRKMAEHLETSCMYAEQQCPSCRLEFERRDLVEHTTSCKRKACEFAELGCTHMLDISNPDKPITCSELEHNDGLHLALIFRQLARAEALTKFRSEPLEEIIERHKKELDCQEQILNMINHPEEQRDEMLAINELEAQTDRAITSVDSAIQDYNALLHYKYPHEIGQPANELHNKARYMKLKELKQQNSVLELVKDARYLPLLHNYGHTIIRIENFAEEYEKQTTAFYLDDISNSVEGKFFFTNQFGALIVPRIHLAGASGDAVRQNRLSVTLTIRKSPYDSVVDWPLKLSVVVSLLPHSGTTGLPITKRQVTDPDSLSMRKVVGMSVEQNEYFGFEQFCKCDLLFPPSPYNINNEVFFEIKVTRLSRQPEPQQPPPQQAPPEEPPELEPEIQAPPEDPQEPEPEIQAPPEDPQEPEPEIQAPPEDPQEPEPEIQAPPEDPQEPEPGQ